MRKCTYPDCAGKHRSRGLCNKHRKWVERGYMTRDFIMLKPITRIGSYHGMVCKIPGCKTRPRRNGLCNNHSCRVRDGNLLPDGTVIRKRMSAYAKDFKCLICHKGGKITKGFCRTHYYEFAKGYIYVDGSPTGKVRKRVASYTGIKCKIGSCYKQARSRGFCTNHFNNYQAGYLSADGVVLRPLPIKNKGRRCKVCTKPARTAGYCPKHYSRKRKGLPLLDRNFYVNKGKTCDVERCPNPALVKGFCEKHYYRLKHGLRMDNGPAVVRKICHCGIPALAKGLCSVHYERKRREKNAIQIRQPLATEAPGGTGLHATEGGV